MSNKPVVTLRKPSPKTQPPQEAVDAFVFAGNSKPADLQASTQTNHQADKSTSQHMAKTNEFRRSTYYLKPSQIRAMKLRAVTEGRNVSELVREAFDGYLGKSE